jgi:tetratricopeptide (TPR) repeat protein
LAGDAEGQEARYWAFISYSHRDAAFARKLHRRLENYVLPARLIGRETKQGRVPKRLAPIFRDRDELPAAHNLTAEVRAALRDSRSLIVVCSPTAATSTWVAREIELFRELHPDRPILAALAKGEPDEGFPDALRQAGADGALIEPLAADFRAEGDGMRPALLKLVAGIIGIGLGELVQRDAQRNLRRVMAVTVLAGITVLIMAALTAFALLARSEAEQQRAKAEGLIEFMITNLHDKLKGVGRLDVMAAVNDKALQYYADQDLSRLPVDSLERRARVLHAMAEVDEARGDFDAELKTVLQAGRTTEALLAAAPNDPERIFNHAQTEFWIGSVAYHKGRAAAAMPSFLAYKRLTDRLVVLVPNSPKYRKEAAYADGTLCATELKKPANPKAAIHHCTEALEQMEELERQVGASEEMENDIINRHAWLSDAYKVNNDYAGAKSERSIEEKILNRLIAADPKNMDLKDTWLVLQRSIALIEDHEGDKASALSRLYRALEVANSLHEFDPKNAEWAKDRDFIQLDISKLNLKKENSNGK